MEYDEIIQTITSGLTGEPEHDVKYLLEQGKLYKTHELAQEILRAIGRLMYKALPPEERDDINRVINNNSLRIEAAIEEAEFQAGKKNFDRALEILKSIIRKIESDNGEFMLFPEDSVSEYHNFRNPFEEILYCEMYKPKKDVRSMEEDFDHLYLVYGALLLEVRRLDEAKIALEKALKINPMNMRAMFELAEIHKLRGEWDEYLDISRHGLKIAYSGSDLGRCYRNIGFYFIEKQEYDVATALYYASMHFDPKSPMAQSELFYIQQLTGETISIPSPDEIQTLFQANDIPLGPDETVLTIAASFGKHAEDNKHYDMARFFYSILYDITHSDEVRAWIENLPSK